MRASSSGTAPSTSTGSDGDDPFVLFLQIFIPTYITLFLLALPGMSKTQENVLSGIFLVVLGITMVVRPDAYIELTKKILKRWFT